MADGLKLKELQKRYASESKVIDLEELVDTFLKSGALPEVIKENNNYYLRCDIFEAMKYLSDYSIKKSVLDYISNYDKISFRKIKHLIKGFLDKEESPKVIIRKNNYYRKCNVLEVLNYVNKRRRD